VCHHGQPHIGGGAGKMEMEPWRTTPPLVITPPPHQKEGEESEDEAADVTSRRRRWCRASSSGNKELRRRPRQGALRRWHRRVTSSDTYVMLPSFFACQPGFPCPKLSNFSPSSLEVRPLLFLLVSAATFLSSMEDAILRRAGEVSRARCDSGQHSEVRMEGFRQATVICKANASPSPCTHSDGDI
jgi:hypothetical protein